MGWVLATGLAAAVLAALILVFKAPRLTWEAIAAALVFGLAGFALQANPVLPGAPKSPSGASADGGEALVKARQDLTSQGPLASSRLLITADGYARQGRFADAAEIARMAAEDEPGNAEAWLALANNLVAHAEGSLTLAAQYAYGRAAAADPTHPGPQFFLGLALAQNGRLDEGRAQWVALLARTPAGAPWRKDLEARLAELDAFIARQRSAPAGQ